MSSEQSTGLDGFAILELMGHRKLGGKLSEQEIAGQAFVRIDIPGQDGDVATQFYSAAAIYAITPTTEEIARSVSAYHRPEPVTRWEFESGMRKIAPAIQAGEEDAPDEDGDAFHDLDDDGPLF